MKQRAGKILKFVVRWGIAIGGVWLVVSYMSLRDSVLLLDPQTNLVQRVNLAARAGEENQRFQVNDPAMNQPITVDRDRIVNPVMADDKPLPIKVRVDGQPRDARLLALRLKGDLNKNPTTDQLLVKLPDEDMGRWVSPADVVGGYRLDVPRPRVKVGIINMVQHANPWLLVLSVLVFPVTFIITSYRWNKMLEAVNVRMGLARAFVINMVGAFYNTFMPGSVGGDVFKAYYASKQTPNRTQAVVSVFVDRVLGLLALVMVGGVMAAYQYAASPDKHDPTATACLRVALASVAILAAVGLGMLVFFQPGVRKVLGLEFILARLPMQRHVEKMREVSRMYRRRPWFILRMTLLTFPVHITVIISAMLAGRAFDLPIRPMYYFTAVPVIVLVGSVPISPQGAGVMEVFAYMLTRQQGATVNQAVALTMCIRLVQVFWNLTGGIFVLRGGYHAPTESEKREMEEEPDKVTR